MRPQRLALLIIPLLALGLYFHGTAVATSDERAVLTIVGRSMLDERQPDTCLATWTSRHFYSGTYGFDEKLSHQAGLNAVAQRARGRSVSIYAGAPPSTPPDLIKRTLDMLMGCGRPIQLSTPIFVGDFSFVSSYTSNLRPPECCVGHAFALRRAPRGWTVVGYNTWDGGVVY